MKSAEFLADRLLKGECRFAREGPGLELLDPTGKRGYFLPLLRNFALEFLEFDLPSAGEFDAFEQGAEPWDDSGQIRCATATTSAAAEISTDSRRRGVGIPIAVAHLVLICRRSG